MASVFSVAVTPRPLEDPLAYLPCSTIVAFEKGAVIYDQAQPSTNLFLVIDGKVKVSRNSEDGRTVVVDIFRPDEFFGEDAFLGLNHRTGQAAAMVETRVMVWSAETVETLMQQRPRLALALLQVLGARSLEYTRRIESFSQDDICRRLSRSLIRFSERMGEQQSDGSMAMMPLTHETLAQYVGTSREIVTHYMAKMRRDGLVRYTRKKIVVYRDALRESIGLTA
jgi:CRP/FNR family transcriptional regulator, cyclic AMP receptor protein